MDAPAVAVSHDGKTMAAAWMDMRSGRNNRDVQWTVSNGGRFPAETTIHDDTAGLQGHPTLAIAEAQHGLVRVGGGPNEQRIYVADSKTRKNAPLSDASEEKCGFPSLAAGKSFVGVAYESVRGIVFRAIMPGR